ncbi:MAG: flagellar hook-length control protein FliK [bacterium]|nr:flagellar hook-length control protein FliK [bacterium]
MVNINPQSQLGFSNQSNASWPVGKPKPQGPEFPAPDSASSSVRGPDQSPGAQAANASQSASAAEGASQAAGIPQQKTWPVSIKDLNQLMVQQNVPNTPLNKSLAMFMLQHAVELSSENFEKLHKLTRGRTDKNALESAVLSLARGLGDAEKSVDFLYPFLSNQGKTAETINKFSQSIARFQNELSQTLGMNPSIMGGLASILGELDEEFKKLLKRAKGDKLDLAEFRRGGLTKDLYSLHQLLGGLEGKLAGKIDENTRMILARFKKDINGLLGNFSSQAILSKSSEKQSIKVLEEFAYWQIPNILGEDPSSANVDILIKKDPLKRGADINPSKTKIVIRLDTPDLGEVSINMVVMDKKIWYTFFAEKESTSKLINSFQKELRDMTETIGKEAAGFQVQRKKHDVKNQLLQRLNLDDYTRVHMQV